MDGPAPLEGSVIRVRRRCGGPRHVQLGLAAVRPCGAARLAEADAARRRGGDRRPRGPGEPGAVLRPGGCSCPHLTAHLRPLAGWRIIADARRARRGAVAGGLAGRAHLARRRVPHRRRASPRCRPTRMPSSRPSTASPARRSPPSTTADVALHHIEWQLPPMRRPCVAQGQIAGVPAKLVLHADGSALLLVACAARHELRGCGSS